MEYAYPDVRRYTIRRILSALGDYDFDGVFVCTRSQSKPAVHGDQFGFNEPVVEEYERRYGVDMMRRNFDLEPWRRLRGEGVTRFLRELRSALDARGMELGIGVPTGDYMGPPLGNLYLDWRTWVREKLLDDLVIDQVAVRCPSFWGLLWPKHQGYGYLVNDEDHYGLKGVDDPGEPGYWSIPLVKGSPEYQGAMERLYRAIRDDYGPIAPGTGADSMSRACGPRTIRRKTPGFWTPRAWPAWSSARSGRSWTGDAAESVRTCQPRPEPG